MSNVVLTVTQLNAYVRSSLESDVRLSGIYICGEISNFKLHYQSGHIYFTLKDAGASIKAVMFRTAAQTLNFKPADGMKVICFARVSLYEKDGQYQLYVTSIQPDGVGSLAVAFEQLKSKLSAEGLFNAEKKRKLPQIVKSVAVVTSKTGAALQDILSIANRRAPYVNIYVYAVQVQGETAAPQMCAALKQIYSKNICDVIIIGRGGGSIEDLWAFNDEKLARTVAVSPVPVISAVGHETDYTICDFVSDLRAPTPSAAAEIAFSDTQGILGSIAAYKQQFNAAISLKLSRCEQNLANAVSSKYFKEPKLLYEKYENLFFEKVNKIISSYNHIVECKELQFANAVTRLNALNPLAVIARGYAVVQKGDTVVDNVSKLSVGDDVTITLNNGKAQATITKTERKS